VASTLHLASVQATTIDIFYRDRRYVDAFEATNVDSP
jgi:hypothetical protein